MDKRSAEFKKVKDLIRNKAKFYNLGLYFTRNTVGDSMTTIFRGDFFAVEVCENYSYFEVFGTTKEESKELLEIYKESK